MYVVLVVEWLVIAGLLLGPEGCFHRRNRNLRTLMDTGWMEGPPCANHPVCSYDG